MAELTYTIAYIDLEKSEVDLFKQIRCRNEVRKAQKNNIEVIEFCKRREGAEEIKKCKEILSETLRHKLVVYSKEYDDIFFSDENTLLLALHEGKIVSFIVINHVANGEIFVGKKSAYLALSATSSTAKMLLPNYILIWSAILLLKNKGFKFFNLGLLEFIQCFDPSLSSAAIFKRKWGVIESNVTGSASLGKMLYYRYFRGSTLLRICVYTIKNVYKKFHERILAKAS